MYQRVKNFAHLNSIFVPSMFKVQSSITCTFAWAMPCFFLYKKFEMSNNRLSCVIVRSCKFVSDFVAYLHTLIMLKEALIYHFQGAKCNNLHIWMCKSLFLNSAKSFILEYARCAPQCIILHTWTCRVHEIGQTRSPSARCISKCIILHTWQDLRGRQILN